VYDHYLPIPVRLASRCDPTNSEETETERIPTAIFGPTCDGLDQICALKSTNLETVKVNDWLIFENMGAYTHTASFVFNGYTHRPDRLHCISSITFDTETSADSEELSYDV
jgi:ornithine decarboxylase